MSKKTESIKPHLKPLPLTKAETAEQRLEELARNKSINHFRVMAADECWNIRPLEGEARVYPDGFEGITYASDNEGEGTYFGNLYLDRRKAYVTYNIEKEYEKWEGKNE